MGRGYAAAKARRRAAAESAASQGVPPIPTGELDSGAAGFNREQGIRPPAQPNQPNREENILNIEIPTETPAAILNSRAFQQQDKDNYVRDFASAHDTFVRTFRARVADGDNPGEARRRALAIVEQNAQVSGGATIGERQALNRLREAASAAGLGQMNTPLQQRRTEVGARQAEAQRAARQAARAEAAARRAARENRLNRARVAQAAQAAQAARGNQ